MWRDLLAFMDILIVCCLIGIQWCISNFARNTLDSIVKKLALNAFFYHVWAERNSRWRINATFAIQRPVACVWKSTSACVFMINTDGSLDQNGAGLGAIIRDCSGEVIYVVVGSVDPGSITVHELQGIEAGLKMVTIHKAHFMEFRSRGGDVVAVMKWWRCGGGGSESKGEVVVCRERK
ncbi:hypothetical protein BVC80_9065g13 [Macleaya cordata]|uniref:RNase H type-1 domain-containing protein n=1 Tax=Macleaya cordata TaxID=56857 RepID=A0A200PNF2_MACCD|nr:hypothetical protein BVC80_9065g13 [Macleaya cordata]